MFAPRIRPTPPPSGGRGSRREDGLTPGGTGSCGSGSPRQRRADQTVLALPAALLPQSRSRAGSSEQSRAGPGGRPTLDHVGNAAQPFHVLAEATPRCRPAHPQPPWGRACLCSRRLRGPPQAEPVGGRHIHPLPPWRTEPCQRHTGGIPCAEGEEAGAPSACSAWARGAAGEERPEENSQEHHTIHLGGGFPASQGDTPHAAWWPAVHTGTSASPPRSSPGGRVPPKETESGRGLMGR